MEEGQASEKAGWSAAYPAEGWRLQIEALRRRGIELRPPWRYGGDPDGQEDFIQRTSYVHERSGGLLPLEGETVVAWPWTGLHRSIVAAEHSRTEGGMGTGTSCATQASDPHQQPDLGSTTRNS